MPARRSIARLRTAVFVLVLAFWLVVGCGGGQQEGENEPTSEQAVAEQETEQETNERLASVSKVTADRMYAGRVAGTDAFIGIAVREETNELIAYVCDGHPEASSESPANEAWFQGPIEGDEASLSNAAGGQGRLQVRLTPEEATGTVTDDEGQAYVFEAGQVDPEGDAGLYWSQPAEGENLSSRGGTIVLADGEERGVRDAKSKPRPGFPELDY